MHQTKCGILQRPKDTAADHKCFSMIDADNTTTATKFFDTMAAEVKPIQTLKEVAQML